jgi:hypothetical protein
MNSRGGGNYSVKYDMNAARFLRALLAALVLFVVAVCEIAQSQSQVSRESNASSPLAESQEKKGLTPTADPTRLPSCPPGGLSPLHPSQPGTGHHKVTLSWNASAPPRQPEGKVVGYCLYRSKEQRAARRDPTCRACEQINHVPLAGLKCVDDLVEDSAVYYYVVTAINAKGKISSSSNEITVAIPPGNQSSSAAAGSSSLPLCRGLSTAK